MKGEKVYIYGRHALTEALEHAPHAIKKVFLAPDQKDEKLLALIKKRGLSVSTMKDKSGAGMVEKGSVHQGVIGLMDPSALLVPFSDFRTSLDITKRPALALLDELTDPHNVGAIIRSAAAFGLSGVLIPEHNQVGITGAVVKTSVGMAFRIPLVAIGNVNQTVRALKDDGFWIYGLAMEGSKPLPAEEFDTPAVFVIGNEGEGIREKTLELCDITLSIPMHPRTESLNAAASAAVVFYQWSTQHPDALA